MRFLLDKHPGLCYYTGELRESAIMGKDTNRRSGGEKPPSFFSRVEEAEQAIVWSQQAIRILCDALLTEQDEARRAKLLALLGSMEETGRGARRQR